MPGILNRWTKGRICRCKRNPFSLKLPDWLQTNDLRIFSLKTYPVCFRMTKGGRFTPSSVRYLNWGIMSNGKCLTARISGVPQSRKRVYIVGYLDGRCAGKILPFPKANGTALIQVHAGKQGERVYAEEGLSCTLTSGLVVWAARPDYTKSVSQSRKTPEKDTRWPTRGTASISDIRESTAAGKSRA